MIFVPPPQHKDAGGFDCRNVCPQTGHHEKHSQHGGQQSHHSGEHGGGAWGGQRGHAHDHSGRERYEQQGRAHHADRYSYGHERDEYKLEPGFYSWG